MVAWLEIIFIVATTRHPVMEPITKPRVVCFYNSSLFGGLFFWSDYERYL